jgi:uncharacterized protein (DUF2236 family)
VQLPCDPLVEAARSRIGVAVRRFLTGETSPPPVRLTRPPDDLGLFAPDSVTWRVHADLSTIVGGLRALLLQTLHPLAMALVAQHSDYRDDPWGRLHRTAAFLATTTYGSTAAAEEAIAAVRAVHDRVVGVTPDGRPYSASEPHLLTWVHVTEVDSFLAAYHRYGAGRLSRREADRYVDEMAMVALALGAEDVPRSVGELEDWFAGVRPELAAGRQARDAVRFLLVPPVPLVARGPYTVVAAAAVGLLPGWARRALWLPVAPGADALVVRPACLALLRALGWVLGPPPRPAAPARPGVGRAA